MSEKFVVGMAEELVFITAGIKVTDEAGKTIDKDDAFQWTWKYEMESRRTLAELAVKTVWITVQGWLRKHWSNKDEISGKSLSLKELSEIFQKHASGTRVGTPALATALIKAGVARDEAIEVAKDPVRAAKAEKWLSSLEVPKF